MTSRKFVLPRLLALVIVYIYQNIEALNHFLNMDVEEYKFPKRIQPRWLSGIMSSNIQVAALNDEPRVDRIPLRACMSPVSLILHIKSTVNSCPQLLYDLQFCFI